MLFFCASDLRAWLEPDGNASRPLTNHCWAPFVRVYFDLTCLSGAQKELPYSPNALQTNWQPLYSHTSLPQVGLGKKNINPFKYPINTKHFLVHVNHSCSLMWICLILFAREPLTEPHITSSAIGFSAEHWKGRFTGRFYKCWPYRLIAPFPFHSLRDVRSVGLISVVKTHPSYLLGLNMPKDTFICFELILMQHP